MDKYTTVMAKKSNPKLKWAEKIKIKGDMRYRYETIDDDRKNVGSADERNRSRLRARLGLTAQVSDDVKAGFALATGTSGGDPVSSNSTFGGSNADKGIVLDQGYIAWKFYDNMTLTAGKTKVPYFKPGKSGLIFDGDLRPEGAHIQYKNNNVFATLGYNFLNSDDGSSGNKDIIETYGAQVGYKFKVDKNTKVTVGLGYYNIPLSGSELADVLADEFGNTASGTTYAYNYEIQQVFGEVKNAQETGDGPVDAAFKAIEKLAKSDTQLKLYSVNAITAGTDSLGEVTVRLEKGGRIVNGQGADTDIIVASVKAYLHALNLIQNPDRLHPQLDGV